MLFFSSRTGGLLNKAFSFWGLERNRLLVGSFCYLIVLQFMRDFNVEVAMATGILHVNLIFPIFSDFHLLQNVHQAHFPKWYLRINYTFRNLIKREFARKGVVCSLNGKYARKSYEKIAKNTIWRSGTVTKGIQSFLFFYICQKSLISFSSQRLD